MDQNKLQENGKRNLTFLCVELGSRDVKLIIVAMLSSLKTLISFFCNLWMLIAEH